MKEIDHTTKKDYSAMSEDEREETNRFILRELYHCYGDWKQVRAIIDEMEENDAERAFDRWSEDRYSIDGIAAHNAANEPRSKDSYIK